MVSIVKNLMGWFSGISASRVNCILSPIKIELRSIFAFTFTGGCEKQKTKQKRKKKIKVTLCTIRKSISFIKSAVPADEKPFQHFHIIFIQAYMQQAATCFGKNSLAIFSDPEKFLLVFMPGRCISTVHPFCFPCFHVLRLQQACIKKLHIHFIIHLNADYIMLVSCHPQCIFIIRIKKITLNKSNAFLPGKTA